MGKDAKKKEKKTIYISKYRILFIHSTIYYESLKLKLDMFISESVFRFIFVHKFSWINDKIKI